MTEEKESLPIINVPQATLTLDQFIERVGGWGVVLSMYMSLGGKVEGLPPVVQRFLAEKLEEAKRVKGES